MKNKPKSPFNSFVYLDSVEYCCPCGGSVEGEGKIIENFTKAHKSHTNGNCFETIMDESYRVLSNDTPNHRTFKVK